MKASTVRHGSVYDFVSSNKPRLQMLTSASRRTRLATQLWAHSTK